MAKIRLDKLLLARNLVSTRQKAQALIGAGQVEVNGRVADKQGMLFPEDAAITLKEKESPYVSRGGLKLAAGLDFFKLDPTGFICADIGASTGGFTDCLLQRGAAKVYAVDVGYGQLDWKLRNDPRVVVMERTNARNLAPGDIPEFIDLGVIDASFISLRLLIPPLLNFFQDKISILALIKPQFEAGKGQVSKGGVVRDPLLHEKIIHEIEEFAEGLGLVPKGIVSSPVLGPKGNREFLIHIEDR